MKNTPSKTSKEAEKVAQALAQADRQAKFVYDLPDDYVACRQGHDLPPFAFGKTGRLPRGISAIGPYRDGSYDILRTCNRCKLILAYHTGTDGRVLEWKPRRKYPQGFLAKGMGRISRTLAYDEGFDRVSGTLLDSARKPSEED